MFWLKTGAVLLAAILVLIEQCRAKDKMRRVGLTVAFGLLLVSVAAEFVRDDAEAEADFERKADMELVQRMMVAPSRLCLRLHPNLNLTEHEYPLELRISMQVLWREPNFGLLSNDLYLRFAKDSAWTIDTSKTSRLVTERAILAPASDGTISLNLADIAFHAFGEQRWTPRSIAELSNIEFEVILTLLPLPGENYPSGLPHSWWPIREIQLYVDSEKRENLLATLMANPSSTHGYTAYLPEGTVLIAGASHHRFRLAPDYLRKNILAHLKSLM